MIRQARIFDEECEHHHGNDEGSEAILIPSSFSLSDKQGCDLQRQCMHVAVSLVLSERVRRTVNSTGTLIVLFASRTTNYGSGWASFGSTATISVPLNSWLAR